jgi:hypothetical protein
MSDIIVHIERLVLEGIDLPAGQRPQLGDALAAELGRLLAEGGLSADWRGGGAWRSAPGGTIELGGPAADPGGLARQIAGAVYGGLGE